MKELVFEGKAECKNNESIYCREKIVIMNGKIIFSSYPLSLLDVRVDSDCLFIDGTKYDLGKMPIVLYRRGKHITKYRDIVEENITITISYL